MAYLIQIEIGIAIEIEKTCGWTAGNSISIPMAISIPTKPHWQAIFRCNIFSQPLVQRHDRHLSCHDTFVTIYSHFSAECQQIKRIFKNMMTITDDFGLHPIDERSKLILRKLSKERYSERSVPTKTNHEEGRTMKRYTHDGEAFLFSSLRCFEITHSQEVK